MTFRIDTVRQTEIQDASRWEISFKGDGGKGVYSTFYTGIDGKGLYTCEFKEGGVTFLPVAESDRFCAPAEMAQEDVRILIAAWMRLRGWGPEVDRHHQVIHRDIVRVLKVDDGSEDSMLEFSPALLQLLGWDVGAELDVKIVDGALTLRLVGC